MSSSKADYEALAEVLVAQQVGISQREYRKMVVSIGQMYKKRNDRFDMTVWMKACGLWTS